MSLRDKLLIPEEAKRDEHSLELIRVWIANESQHFSLRVGLWDDPAAWGLLLADLARNIAKSYEQDAGRDAKATLSRIRAAFTAELDDPTG